MDEKQPLLGGSYGNRFADPYSPTVKKTAEVINIDTAKVYFRYGSNKMFNPIINPTCILVIYS